MDRKRFGKEVGKIVDAFSPSDDVLSLSDSISDPVIAHVYTFSGLWFDCIERDANGVFVVAKNMCWWLGIS